MAKKKIILILTVFEDGTHSIIEPDKETSQVAAADSDPIGGDGGETPTKPPGNP